MIYDYITNQLLQNKSVIQSLLENSSKEAYTWRPNPEHWCLLEIICHLHDEEREDFRTRLRYVLDTPDQAPPPIHPQKWVKERKYMEQNFEAVLGNFLKERDASIAWLRSLENPKWDNVYQHPKFGPFSGHFYISNWLAHDYLHIRQITRLKYNYLKEVSGEHVKYAGNW